MLFKKASISFLPKELKNNPLHPDYEERVATIHTLIVMVLLEMAITGMYYAFGYHYPYYFFQGILSLMILPFYRRSWDQQATFIVAIVSYPMWYHFISVTGGIFSVNINILYMHLMAVTVGTDIKKAPVFLCLSLVVLFFLYLSTPQIPGLNTRLFALVSHAGSLVMAVLTISAFIKQKHKLVINNKYLQNSKITSLNDEVARRTKEVNNMRQTLAADFHDETGNMLSAISRQAAMLKLEPDISPAARQMVDHIMANSNQLYASSRHFIWNLHNDSDDPGVVFSYLTGLGQSLYDQFNIGFSSENNATDQGLRLEPFAAINLIFIFKEAMTNVLKHAQASEVLLSLNERGAYLVFKLVDDGLWKEQSSKESHHGLNNIKKRCEQNGFLLSISHANGIGTSIEIAVPVVNYAYSENVEEAKM